MAVAVVFEAMTLPQQKGLHPFFDKARRDTSRAKTPSAITAAAGEVRDTSQDAVQSANTEYLVPQRMTSIGHDGLIETKVKKRGRKPKARCGDDTVDTDSAQDAVVAEVVSDTIYHNSEGTPIIERLQDGPDNASHDSKRRRLSPPKELGSWFEQLQREAKAKSERKVEFPGSNTLGEEAVANTQNITDTRIDLGSRNGTSSEQIFDNEGDGNSALPSSSCLSVGELHAMSASENHSLQSDERKVLRLNGKGGLGSPNPREKATQLEDKADYRQPRSSKRTVKKKSMIAVIRYGALRNQENESLAQRIQRILDKPPRSEQEKEATHKNQAPASKVIQAKTPAKITHPFFLGKVNCSTLKMVAPRNATNQLPNTESQPVFKSFTTPGKLRAHMLSSIGDEVRSENQVGIVRPTRTFRLPGTVEPAWPSKEFQRRKLLPASQDVAPSHRSIVKHRKEKNSSQSSELQDQVFWQKYNHSDVKADPLSSSKAKHSPQRLILTGESIRSRVTTELSKSLVQGLSSSTESGLKTIHPVIRNLWKVLLHSTSAYDNGVGETQSWSSKYAPQTVQHVLQDAKEMRALKDWLSKHTVASVEGSLTENTIAPNKTPVAGIFSEGKVRHRSKRDKHDELGGFVVASDEEDSEMIPLDSVGNRESAGTARSLDSVIRDQSAISAKNANAVLISGPNGCGKTAAVFAVAKELGFDVFEINAGSRRSGKDILDKVGNMTLNHQVRKIDSAVASANISDIDDSLPFEPDEQQSTLTTFFTAKGIGRSGKNKHSKALRRAEERLAKASRHKQSLILLEEVDILFEEDKQFWETVLDLAVHSKRPIILTCTDESLVPLGALSLHAILRFRAPPPEITVDYLLLLAAAEGHFVSRRAIEQLYHSRHMDLRASITDLNFWCQMAIGAPRAGIDWFLPRWPPGADRDSLGQKLRVISDQSLPPSMNMFGGCYLSEEDALWEAWNHYDLEPTFLSGQAFCKANNVVQNDLTPHDQHTFLVEFDKCLDMSSAADVFCRVDLPTMSMTGVMDATEPVLDAKSLADYTLAFPVLDAQKRIDWMQIDTRLQISMHLFIKQYFESQLRLFDSSCGSENGCSSDTEATVQSILGNQRVDEQQLLSRHDFSAAFDPISETPSAHVINANLHSLSTSSFDRPLSLITTDLAPYVRSIVYYDQQLEEQRQRLSDLLSQSSVGGRSSKRLRTTRASRSALEGSRRANTRRERWFDAKPLSFDTVLRTGGENWPRAVHFDDVTPAASMESNSRASSADPLATI